MFRFLCIQQLEEHDFTATQYYHVISAYRSALYRIGNIFTYFPECSHESHPQMNRTGFVISSLTFLLHSYHT